MSAINFCGLWRRESKKGLVYYEGRINKDVKLLAFKNTYKEAGDNRPDLLVKIAPVETRSGTTDESPERHRKPEPLPPENDVPF